MLKNIHIQNYALIENLHLDLQQGFSVITGETGAGKSIILGAIALLMGQRADNKVIRTGASKCIVEATFRIGEYQLQGFFDENELEYDAEECILRREVSATGKSRAFINDSPVSLTVMKSLGERLIDVHSQHQNLLINNKNYQLSVVDLLANNGNELENYRATFTQYKEASKLIEVEKEKIEKAKADEEYISFQYKQLADAHLQEDEQEELEKEHDIMSHAEEIKEKLYTADNLLQGEEGAILSNASKAMQALESIASVYESANEWAERMQNCLIDLKDMAHDVSLAVENVEYDPTEMQRIEERLNEIYSLQQKFHVNSIKELLELEEDFKQKLDSINNSDEYLLQLKAKQQQLLDEVMQQGKTITKLRQKAAGEIETQMKNMLVPLGMPNVQFQVDITSTTHPEESGLDKINFLFSANKNSQLQSITEVASGGEIARVMLSLKALIASETNLPTIIFDEIDTGVSGSIAERMAYMMKNMCKQKHQVISITHLPQIAAQGDVHYKVYKEDTETGTESHIILLDNEKRIEEIANMLSGSKLTEAALNNAKELLKQNL